ncbi:MAG: YggT family protein [Clostridiaceae bacterium]|nr:YggT family protein [Clostridiaceae bacterium]
MEPMTRQSETLSTKPKSHTAKRIVGVIFGVIEIILGFRLIFKLLGANPNNGFIKIIYGITQFFVGIFESIFPKVSVAGTQAVFEPATLIAIILIALLALIVMKLMTSRKSSSMVKNEFTTGSARSTGPNRPTDPTEKKDSIGPNGPADSQK